MTKANDSAFEQLLGEAGAERISKLSFEEGLKVLEELVSKVESGTLPLEKAVLSYEAGSKLVNHLRALLSGAEQKLKILQRPTSGAKG